MSRIALPRIGTILEERRKRIEGDLAEAQRFKESSDAAIAAHEKALAEARGRAQTLANETREKAAAAAEARRKELDAKLNAHIAEAEKAIAATRTSAMTNVRGIASEAATAIVERLTGIAPAEPRRRQGRRQRAQALRKPMFEAEFWVAVAFVIFVGVLGYFGVHKLLLKGIDERRDRIKAELDEARRLKEEAQALLANYQRKQQEAEREAQAIVASAKGEAERLAAEAEAKIEEFVARRTKMAESKIAQAEAQALADVRSAAADAAVAAAETILTRTVKGKVADDLITKGIADLKSKLN